MTDAKYIAELAKKGAARGDCGRMCDDCAFKAGTEANKEEYTTAMALQCVVYDMARFMCHKEDKGTMIRLDVPCVGFLYARQALERKTTIREAGQVVG